MRAAFSGGLAGGADVLSLAAQLVGGGGEQLADELVADPVDPMGEDAVFPGHPWPSCCLRRLACSRCAMAGGQANLQPFSAQSVG